MRWGRKSRDFSFPLLNATQFLVALNDNIFKLLVIYLLIHVKGPEAAPTVLSLVGAIFVIPFLLFSSSAGVLADRISKRTIIVSAKAFEILIMAGGVAAVWFHSEWGAYLSLFFLSAEAAVFGPSKFGIIPELVEPKMVSKANGSITSFTYLAIIFGTFLASFLTDITNKNFLIVSAFCFTISIIGFGTSLGIRKTEPQNSPKKFNLFFVYEIYQTLKSSFSVPHLLPCLFGSAFFLFIGAFTQLNIIPFAMQSLQLTDVGGGYLFLPTAVGIAIGAIIAGQLSKDRVEPGLSCISGFFIALLFIGLYFCAHSIVCVVIILALLGMFGGAFLIPFDSFIQVNSPDEKRGQVIAASNFFSFVGVLFASFFLYILSEKLRFSAASGFALMGMISLFATLILFARLSSLFFPFFVRKVLKRFRSLKIVPPFPESPAVIIIQNRSGWDAVLFSAAFNNWVFLIPSKHYRMFLWCNYLVDSLRIIPDFFDEEILKKVLEEKKGATFGLLLRKDVCSQDTQHKIFQYFVGQKLNTVYAHGKKERITRNCGSIRYVHKLITIYFSDSAENDQPPPL